MYTCMHAWRHVCIKACLVYVHMHAYRHICVVFMPGTRVCVLVRMNAWATYRKWGGAVTAPTVCTACPRPFRRRSSDGRLHHNARCVRVCVRACACVRACVRACLRACMYVFMCDSFSRACVIEYICRERETQRDREKQRECIHQNIHICMQTYERVHIYQCRTLWFRLSWARAARSRVRFRSGVGRASVSARRASMCQVCMRHIRGCINTLCACCVQVCMCGCHVYGYMDMNTHTHTHTHTRQARQTGSSRSRRTRTRRRTEPI